MKIYIEKKTKKDDINKTYVVVVADLGYSKKYLCYDKSIICELLDISPRQLAELKVGVYELNIQKGV